MSNCGRQFESKQFKLPVVFCHAALPYRHNRSNVLSFFASSDRSLLRDLFAVGAFGSFGVPAAELSSLVGCGSKGR
ncbi:hypothetical protein Tco_0623352 [Tanacetum coccineum]